MVNWDQVRAEFPVMGDRVYLNAGTYGPLPRCCTEAMAAAIAFETTEGRACDRYYEKIDAVRARTLSLLAALLDVSTNDLTLTCSTTTGCHLVLAGLGLKPGDEIITTNQEHHSFITALRASPAKLIVVDIDDVDDDETVERLRAVANKRVQLIALSHVTWTSGRILPIERISSIGPPLLVDGAQSVGAIPVKAKQLGCDFMIFSGQKWLLGPDATGGIYIHPNWQARLRVALPSSYGHQPWAGQPHDIPLLGAAKFTVTPTAIPSLASWNASLSFVTELGPERFERAKQLAQKFYEMLSTHVAMVRPPDATILSFAPSCNAEKLRAVLESNERILTRTIPHKGWIRCCVGFWNNEQDLNRLVAAILKHQALLNGNC